MPMKRSVFVNACILVILVLVFELLARLLVAPSSVSCGTLFGRHLPPIRVVPESLW
jgi:hypothetical protein